MSLLMLGKLSWETPKNKFIKKRKWVYQTLKHLQGYEHENDFPQLLQNAINILQEDEETLDFGNYFSKNYSSNSALWARCYRKGCSVNTNMHLESMHRTLKHCYLEGKVVKRLDKGLHAVLKFIRDKTLERIIKKTKGKNNIYLKKYSFKAPFILTFFKYKMINHVMI
ncbi:hypothetical protein NQ317_015268 [Molorchus minor]|uniref:Uncharacterized protein n=1 Tax=Molorchus minor TaxID=1323400 RepID=A0ABQ9IYE4_9CUCU|nr:hypothetical protein NQ317_015268 [Molorchus minor]